MISYFKFCFDVNGIYKTIIVIAPNTRTALHNAINAYKEAMPSAILNNVTKLGNMEVK
mgnify:CR=1 FL=1